MIERKSKAEQEFIEFYDKHADGIFRFCYFRLFHRERAQEMMQEAFLKSWEYIVSGKQVDNIKAFVYKIALNLLIDQSRKNKKEFSLEEMQAAGFEPIEKEDRLQIEAGIDRRLGNVKALAALQQMEPAHRDIITMRYVNGLEPKDIAKILDESENAVSVRINRAKKQLRDLLKKQKLSIYP